MLPGGLRRLPHQRGEQARLHLRLLDEGAQALHDLPASQHLGRCLGQGVHDGRRRRRQRSGQAGEPAHGHGEEVRRRGKGLVQLVRQARPHRGDGAQPPRARQVGLQPLQPRLRRQALRHLARDRDGPHRHARRHRGSGECPTSNMPLSTMAATPGLERCADGQRRRRPPASARPPAGSPIASVPGRHGRTARRWPGWRAGSRRPSMSRAKMRSPEPSITALQQVAGGTHVGVQQVALGDALRPARSCPALGQRLLHQRQAPAPAAACRDTHLAPGQCEGRALQRGGAAVDPPHQQRSTASRPPRISSARADRPSQTQGDAERHAPAGWSGGAHLATIQPARQAARRCRTAALPSRSALRHAAASSCVDRLCRTGMVPRPTYRPGVAVMGDHLPVAADHRHHPTRRQPRWRPARRRSGCGGMATSTRVTALRGGAAAEASAGTTRRTR